MSADNWPACIAFTLDEEGGLCDTPGDPGGLTNFGISQRAYPDLDIRNLTRAAAETIYGRDYWPKVSGDSLPAGVDLMVFDMAVNAGTRESAMILQRCVGVTADGIVGPLTLLAVKGTDLIGLIKSLRAAQLAFYESLDGWAEFGQGWTVRVQRRVEAALAMSS
ncbi:MAG: hypothetical protein KGL39_50195 [Patescibacteria group bacterium]|nr:hypothetical protein [Patescibacteria group bacterium]